MLSSIFLKSFWDISRNICRSKQRFILTASRNCRLISSERGALAGGFSKEGLRYWAATRWSDSGEYDSSMLYNREDPLYTDLYFLKVSHKCAKWIDSNNIASSPLGLAFFGSRRFIPERVLMTPLFLFSDRNVLLPKAFDEDQTFLAWKCCQVSPLEVLLEWNVSFPGSNGKLAQGITLLAFDPALKRVYFGNCVLTQKKSFNCAKPTPFLQKLLALHANYSKYLLEGMVIQLESMSIVDHE
mmetsp:Transcript_20817/g.29216  ORF Transcript_20817/g.29216 Transcript_20817/m.29216 type:complete len:242 (+) Transcript_20817:56-781(+)